MNQVIAYPGHIELDDASGISMLWYRYKSQISGLPDPRTNAWPFDLTYKLHSSNVDGKWLGKLRLNILFQNI